MFLPRVASAGIVLSEINLGCKGSLTKVRGAPHGGSRTSRGSNDAQDACFRRFSVDFQLISIYEKPSLQHWFSLMFMDFRWFPRFSYDFQFSLLRCSFSTFDFQFSHSMFNVHFLRCSLIFVDFHRFSADFQFSPPRFHFQPSIFNFHLRLF